MFVVVLVYVVVGLNRDIHRLDIISIEPHSNSRKFHLWFLSR